MFGKLVGFLKTYSSDYARTTGGATTALSGGSITAVFSCANKATPGDSSAMIFRSVDSVLDAMTESC